MIYYVKGGDLLKSNAQVLVNPVNTVGVMGKGLALAFRELYPEMYNNYVTLCKNGFHTGQLFIWRGKVLLFPTKEHWRNSSKYEYIEQGLKKFVANYARLGINSIAFPKLGCGCGGLKWSEVKPLMEQYLGQLPITVYIYV